MVKQVQTKLDEMVRFNILEKKLVERALNAPMSAHHVPWVANPDFTDIDDVLEVLTAGAEGTH